MLPALLALALATGTPAPTAAPGGARIVAQQARWTSLAPIDDLSAAGDGLFLISGTVRNDGGTPLAHVRLVYELLAADVVVASEYGYNRRAEGLRAPEVESNPRAATPLAVAPLAPGETDMFRMIFLRDAVPRFDTWRVRVEAASPSEPR